MARMQIYIPDDLMKRVKQAQEGQYPLNVSRVCQEALEAVLSDRKPQKKEPTAPTAPARRVIRSRDKDMDKMRAVIEDVQGRGNSLGRVARRT